MELRGKHVAITGASSGIGEALARELASAGALLTLVARREDRLARIAREVGGETFVRAADLADAARATDWLVPASEALGPIDVLVNNAGLQIVGAHLEVEPAAAEAMQRVNLLTPLALTRAVLPGMRARGRGAIVDICSAVAFAPMPYQTFYNATKAGLAAASESLRSELRGSGVQVLTVYPGPMSTSMGRAAFSAYGSSLLERFTPTGSPEVLARLIRRGLELERPRIIYPRFYALSRHFPGTTRFVLDRLTPSPRRLRSGEVPAALGSPSTVEAAVEVPLGPDGSSR